MEQNPSLRVIVRSKWVNIDEAFRHTAKHLKRVGCFPVASLRKERKRENLRNEGGSCKALDSLGKYSIKQSVDCNFKFSLGALQSCRDRDYLIIQYFCVRDGCLFQCWIESRIHEWSSWSIMRQDYTRKYASQLVQIIPKIKGKFEKRLIFNFKCHEFLISFCLFSFSNNQSNDEVKNVTKVKNLWYFLAVIWIHLKNEESSSHF